MSTEQQPSESQVVQLRWHLEKGALASRWSEETVGVPYAPAWMDDKSWATVVKREESDWLTAAGWLAFGS